MPVGRQQPSRGMSQPPQAPPAAVEGSRGSALRRAQRLLRERLSDVSSRLPWQLLPAAPWCAVAVALGEALIVAALHHRQIAGVWELEFGLIWLLPTLIAACGSAGFAGFVAFALLSASEQRAARGVLATLLSVASGSVAWGVSFGRHFTRLEVRAGFVVAAALLAGAAAWWLAPPLRRFWLQRPRRLGVAALCSIIALELANRFVLVRLYPAWHLALALAALALAPALVTLVAAEPRKPVAARSRPLLLGVLLSLALVGAAFGLAPRAATKLARFDNFRWILGEHAPIAGQAVAWATVWAPPPPLAAVACSEGAEGRAGEPCRRGSQGATRGRLDWEARDILLVSIDALRADHVGAYGYGRPTTPHLDALAATGTRFEHAYTATPHTSYSVTSLMTGKYIRPLLLQGAGQGSPTWATLLRQYGYRTAAFYPPAVFFIDRERFDSFRSSFLGFEHRKVEFLEGQERVSQVAQYLSNEPRGQRVFLWLHLFGPHEPYLAHPEHDFGSRDIDRYDAEIRASDETLGGVVKLFRERSPDGVVIVTADHGEEFGDHGGRYHGTTVYEEQVRVPLVIDAPRSVSSKVVEAPVQTIDLLPTVLGALDIPKPPALRGRDLAPLLAGPAGDDQGFAYAETEEQALLAEGRLRLICERRIGACRLYDLQEDPTQSVDATRTWSAEATALRERLRRLTASHGAYERSGLQAGERSWPAAILRGVAGDGEAVTELAALLDDADREIRRKAAELLFELARPEAAPALRLALARDEDAQVRRWSALALTRLGEGAPLTYELQKSSDLHWRRLAALALAESGDRRGTDALIHWWQDGAARDYRRSRELLEALGASGDKDAVWPLIQSLDDVRLRPYIAKALARIGDSGARGALAKALAEERYQGARVALADAIVSLGGEGELVRPLTRFLGVPDPLPGGLGFAMQAGILQYVGGPEKKALRLLRSQADAGAAVRLVIPRADKGTPLRLLVRGSVEPGGTGNVRVGRRANPVRQRIKDRPRTSRKLPILDNARTVVAQFESRPGVQETAVELPAQLGLSPGLAVELVVVAERGTTVEALAVVPRADELPPPPPEPWTPTPAPSEQGDSPQGAGEP